MARAATATATATAAAATAAAINPASTFSYPAPAGERRTTTRQSMDALGVLTDIDGDKQLEVAVLNLSPHGCAFRSPVAFRPGTTYTMRIGTGPRYLASTLLRVLSPPRRDGSLDRGAGLP